MRNQTTSPASEPQTPSVVMQSEIIQIPKIIFKKETVYDTKTITTPVMTMEVCLGCGRV